MTIEELLKYYGNTYQFELATGLSHTNIDNWRRRGYIPLMSQRKIERITEGFFKVRLEDLGDK